MKARFPVSKQESDQQTSALATPPTQQSEVNFNFS
jgi:hypothetical protein